MPHLSLTSTSLPTRSARKGFGLTGLKLIDYQVAIEFDWIVGGFFVFVIYLYFFFFKKKSDVKESWLAKSRKRQRPLTMVLICEERKSPKRAVVAAQTTRKRRESAEWWWANKIGKQNEEEKRLGLCHRPTTQRMRVAHAPFCWAKRAGNARAPVRART